jgi:PIN domain nuclease of toxin-antitoxin system
MMVLDTHIWIWWVHNDPKLPLAYRNLLAVEQSNGFGGSAVSCWEVAMLSSRGRIALPVPCLEWLRRSLIAKGCRSLELTPEISVDAASLPGSFHRDPADQMIVATARVHNLPLVTLDARIRQYPHVHLAP